MLNSQIIIYLNLMIKYLSSALKRGNPLRQLAQPRWYNKRLALLVNRFTFSQSKNNNPQTLTELIVGSQKAYQNRQNYQNLKKSTKKILMSAAMILYLSFLAAYYQRLFIKRINQQCLIVSLKNNVSVKTDETQIKESPMYEEMKQIFQAKSCDDKIKFITGYPGYGKTTAIKQLLRQKIENGETVYYFTFQKPLKYQQSLEDMQKQLNSLLKGFKELSKSKKYERKEIKVVIDGIEKIYNSSSKTLLLQFITSMYACSRLKCIDIICISNSCRFLQQFEHQNSFSELMWVFTLQAEPSKEFIKKLFMKIINKHKLTSLPKDPSLWEELSDFIFEAHFSPAMIKYEVMKKICSMDLKIMTKAQAIEEFRNLKNEDTKSQTAKVQNIMKVISKKKERVQAISLLLKQQKWQTECWSIYKKLNTQEVRKAFKELRRNDLITFCTPNTKRERDIFNSYLKKNDVTNFIQ